MTQSQGIRGIDGRQVVIKRFDQNSNIVTYADVADMQFLYLQPSTGYVWEFVVFFQSSITTTGIGLKCVLTVTGSGAAAAPSYMKYGANIPRTTQLADWQASSAPGGALLTTDAPTAENMIVLRGTVVTGTEPSCDLKLQLASEVAASTVNVWKGSHGIIQEETPYSYIYP